MAGSGPAREVAFVDGSVADHEALVAGVRPGVETVRLDPARDELAQMAAWAETHSGYQAIHVVSHAAPGALRLGGTSLDGAALCDPAVAGPLAQLGRALNRGGDLLLYGCSLAAGPEGDAYLAAMAQATGADVAASTGPTGAARLGGDWALEAATGAIEARSLALIDFQGVLSTISFSSGDTDLDAGHLFITRTETGSGKDITFAEVGSSGLAYDGEGLYSMAEAFPGVSLRVSAPSGYTFDITSFGAQMSTGQLQIKLTYANGGTATFAQTGISNAALTSLSVFGLSNTPINDVTQVELTSDMAGVFNHFVITDVKAPPSFTGQYSHSFYDTEVANSFPNVTGTLTATPSSTTNSLIASYGITGGTTGTYAVGGSSYDITKAGGYGTLYVNSGTGAYVYVPVAAAIETLSTRNDEGTISRVTKVDSFVVTATDSVGATAENAVSIDLTGQNDTPEITSGATATVAENSAGTVYTVAASDRDSGQTRTYSLSGTDAGLFAINATTGAVSFNSVPNFEAPGDIGGNNVYDITVKATDNAAIVTGFPDNNDSTPKAVRISVINVNDAPTGGDTTATFDEDSSLVFSTDMFGFNDAEDAAFDHIRITALPVVGTMWLDANHDGVSNDAALAVGSTISATDITSGYLRFTPAANASGDDYATFSFKVSDGSLYAAVASNLTFDITPINDAPTGISISNASVSTLDSADVVVGTLSATDPDSSSWTYSILSVDGDVGSVFIAQNFNISGSTLRATLPSSLTPTTHRVVVRATDAGGLTYDEELNIKVDSALVVTTTTDEAYVSGETLAEVNGGTGLSLKEAIGFANEHTSGTTIRFAEGLGDLTVAGDLALSHTLVLDFGSVSARTIAANFAVDSGKALIVQNAAGSSVAFSGVISGAGDLRKAGAGTLTLTGTNTYTGATNVAGGTLETSGDNKLADNSNVTVASSAILSLGGNETIGTLSGAGTVALGTKTLSVNESAATAFGGSITGSGGLTKAGTGTLTLSAANTYSGATIISAGALAVDGALSTTSGVSVASGATLSGTGTIFAASSSNTLTVDGTLSPGSGGPGALTVNGTLLLNGTLAVDVVSATEGSGYDQVSVAGNVTLGSASVLSMTTTLSGSAADLAVIGNDAAEEISGTFAGIAEGGAPAGISYFTVSYRGGTGNDLILSFDPPPPAPTITSTAPVGTMTSAAYTMTGTAEAGATVKIYDAGTLVGTATADADGHWSCALTLDDGATALTVTATDAAGNVSTATSDASWTIDTKAPEVATIARTQPGPVTLGGTLEWRVTFTEPVTGVDLTDFELKLVDGSATATLATVTASTTGVTGAEYLVTATGVAGIGTLRLDAKKGGTGISDALGHVMTRGYVYGQSYTHAHATVPAVWGNNNFGQLGLGSSDAAAHSLPAFVPNTGALAGKTVVALSVGGAHTLALTSEGKVYAWGNNVFGQLGNGSKGDPLPTPVEVIGLGVTETRKMVAISAGSYHSVALDSDGHVYAWGDNSNGELGNDPTTESSTPVAVTMDGGSALSDKRVVAISAGNLFTLALCRDGTLVAWGFNNNGQLGNGTMANARIPVAVATGSGSALKGKTVVAMAAGVRHSAALCSDGTVATWGNNNYGQLGNGTRDYSSTPVAVNMDSGSALHGKTVVAISAGYDFMLALCDDGTRAVWGYNNKGQLGNGTTANELKPVAVDMDSGSALYDKTVVALAAGSSHSLALRADGTLATWGLNNAGQLGDGAVAQVSTPKAINDPLNPVAGSALLGRTPYQLAPGCYAYHSAVLVSATPVTAVATPAAGSYKAGDSLTFTLTTGCAVTVTGSPRLALTLGSATVYGTYVSGSGTTSLVFTYTVQAGETDSDGIAVGRAIDWNSGTITDALGGSIAPILPAYTLPVIAIDTMVPAVPTITSTAPAGIKTSAAYTMTGTAESGATVKIYNAGTLVGTVTADADGHWSCALTLDDGATALTVTATDAAGNESTAVADSAWTIDTTAPEVATIARTQPGPVTTAAALKWRVTFTEPVTGVDAGDFVVTSIVGGASGTISSVTGSDATSYVVTVAVAGTGRVRLDLVAAGSGIADAAAIPLSANFARGQVYVASSSAMLVSWGYNGYGQLGDDTITDAAAPLPVLHGAIPTDQPVVSVVCGDSHSVALTEYGDVYAWGYNSYGQLGNSANATSKVPVAVSALGSKAVAVAAGADFSLALTEAGKVYAWGYNLFGQLGNGTTTNSNAPVEVSALTGKGVVAISAGGGFALALTGDGAVYAWGQNVLGQLGNGTYVGTVTTPAQVTGFSGRTVVAISCGASHALALTADGAVYTWGYNYDGQLGNGTTTASNRPAEVTALSGQGVSALQAGTYHSLALTESGTVYAWGSNANGQLGDGSQTNRLTPVAVAGFSGRGVIELSAGEVHTLALLADGSALICGTNERSVLGDSVGVSPALTPVPVATTNVMVGRSLLALSTDVSRYSVLALASPDQGALSVSPAGGDLGSGASIAFTVTFPSAVTVTGSPRLALLVGTETRYATYTSGSGTTTLTFNYAVTAGDNDADGIEVTAFDLAGGSLLDAGGMAASVHWSSLDTSALRVDTTAPAQLTAFAAVASGAGQIEMTFTAPEACTVYFTTLDASQTAGTAVQIVAGQDAAANPVRHGSLALAAGTAGTYTLKGLAAGTAYTVHATVADAAGNVCAAAPAVATATTSAVPSLTDMDWSQMTFEAPCGMDPQLAFAPDGTPYVAFQSTDLSGKLLVQRYVGGVWSPVGGTTGLSTGAAYALKLVFAPDGTPYVAYRDAALAFKTVVKRFTGGAWSAVGPDSGLSSGEVTALSLAFAPDGTPWLAYADSTLSSKAVIRRYVAGAWTYVGSSTGATAAGATTLDLVFGPDGTAHLAFRNSADSGRPAVWFWSEASAAWLAGDATASLPAVDLVRLAAAPDGTLYIAYRNSADLKVGVARHLAAMAWTQIGDSLPASTWLDIAAGADGVPFLCYRDGTSGPGNRAYVATYVGAKWIPDPTGAAVAAGEVSYPSLQVAPDGVPYVVCRDDTTNKVMVSRLVAAVTSVGVPGNGTYVAGQTLAFTVNYSGPVSVTGTPRVPLTIGSTTQYADYTATGSTSTALRFLYTVQAGDLDPDGVAVGAALDLDGGTIIEASGWNAGTTLRKVGGCSGIRIDAVAPDTTITSHPANPSASASATFTFASSDGTGVGHFEASLDGGAFATATSPASLTSLADGSHTFAVRAIDAAGNVDSSPASYTWTIDTTAPAAPGIAAPLTTPTSISGTGEPGSTVRIYDGTTLLGSAAVGADGRWTLSLGALPGGAHTLTATVTDTAGHTGASQSFRFASTHAGDSDGDWRIALPELLWMVELFNTADGALRTGAYHSAPASAEGFAPGSGPLEYYHSADTDRNGRLDLPELLRAIELYNAMNGTTRTGAYHIDSGSADGFATGSN